MYDFSPRSLNHYFFPNFFFVDFLYTFNFHNSTTYTKHYITQLILLKIRYFLSNSYIELLRVVEDRGLAQFYLLLRCSDENGFSPPDIFLLVVRDF